jgi:unsaturated rhamnogalacturonyl hydrolase
MRLLRFCRLFGLTVVTLAAGPVLAQSAPWSQRMEDSTIARWPEGRWAAADAPWHWNYELGTLLDGMDAVWYGSAKGEYYRYLKQSVDQFVGPDGSIPTYHEDEDQLDSILLGRQLVLLYEVTQNERYDKAAKLLREQLAQQPKTTSGGFWHKKIYPN